METVISIAAFIVLFIVFRTFVLWYWRMNEVADALNEINVNIAKLAGVKPLQKKAAEEKPSPKFKKSKHSDWQ